MNHSTLSEVIRKSTARKINQSRLSILLALKEAKASRRKYLTPKEVAALIGQTSAGVTGACDPLQQRDLINRVTSKTDRREIEITITESGEKLLAEILNNPPINNGRR